MNPSENLAKVFYALPRKVRNCILTSIHEFIDSDPEALSTESILALVGDEISYEVLKSKIKEETDFKKHQQQNAKDFLAALQTAKITREYNAEVDTLRKTLNLEP